MEDKDRNENTLILNKIQKELMEQLGSFNLGFWEF